MFEISAQSAQVFIAMLTDHVANLEQRCRMQEDEINRLNKSVELLAVQDQSVTNPTTEMEVKRKRKASMHNVSEANPLQK